MEKIDTKNLTYNDTPEVRLLSSENFNWCLDKSTGISCCWGKTAKETPNYDPCGPQEIVLEINQFNLEKYIKYFNFLANIKLKENNEIVDTTDNTTSTENKICLSTFGSFILKIGNEELNLEDISKFLEYIKFFNVDPKIEIKYSNKLLETIEKISKISNNIIISTDTFFNGENLLEIIKYTKENKINISFKLIANKNTKSELNSFINKFDNSCSVILYFTEPYFSTRNYLTIQSKCIQKNLTNIVIAQCSKRHYSKDVIGSLLLELPCSFCKYSLYVRDNEIFDCEKQKNKIGIIEDFNTIHDFWYSEKICKIRESLIDQNKC